MKCLFLYRVLREAICAQRATSYEGRTNGLIQKASNALLIYSVPTYFRLEQIGPSAGEVEGQQFLALTQVRVSQGLSHVLLSSLAPSLFSLDQSSKNKYLSSRRLYKLQAILYMVFFLGWKLQKQKRLLDGQLLHNQGQRLEER